MNLLNVVYKSLPCLLVITCLLSVPYGSLAQSNDWAPIGAIWHYEAFGGGFCFNPQYEGYYTMESVQDSQVQGKQVRIIERRHHAGLSVEDRDFYMYEDSGRVYYFHEVQDTFFLLFDFNARAGDTLTLRTDTLDFALEFYGPNQGGGLAEPGLHVYIDKVDTVQMAGKSRKGYHTKLFSLDQNFTMGGQNWPGPGIVEGIGDLGNMFGNYSITNLCYHRGFLRCYQDSNGFEMFSTVDCDKIATALDSQFPLPEFQLFPTQSPTVFLLSLRELSPFADYSLHLRDLQGHQLHRWSIEAGSGGTVQRALHFPDLASGTYLLSLYRAGEWQGVKKVGIR